ncbi:MAG: hypothetical protein ABIG32_02155 [Candidatus Uhrbacteria bacterium]|nr:hypothetical protein [Patescibacteria group bacterium]MBU1907253.1 hypothetical protein [Patescibacteria group bacterium]
MFWRIVIGLIIAVVGFFMIWKTTAFQGWTGRIAWAEEKLGGGGTSTFLKILGLLIIFVGVFYATGIFQDIIGWFFALLTPGE